jgi:hypothetical protein
MREARDAMAALAFSPPAPGRSSRTATRRSASITLRCGHIAEEVDRFHSEFLIRRGAPVADRLTPFARPIEPEMDQGRRGHQSTASRGLPSHLRIP